MTLLAVSGSGWVEVIVALSIFVPVVITIVIVIFFFRAARDDPDNERLKRAQEDYERAHRDAPR